MSVVVEPNQRHLNSTIFAKSSLLIFNSDRRTSIGLKETDKLIRRKCARFVLIVELIQSPTASTTFI
jgi:hypothetical protein